MRKDAFSLVEVALALGILGFAMVSIVGLVSVGLNASRENLQRSIETQILDWVQSEAKAAYQGDGLANLDKGPHAFDRSGFHLRENNSPDCIYTAELDLKSQPLPDSEQSLWCIEVVIRRIHGTPNNILSRNALWFNK